MTDTQTSAPVRPTWLPFVAIALVGAACYANSLSAPFSFDSHHYIEANPAIRRLWPMWELLAFAQTRPVGYATFAVNYALHGDEVGGYHVVNIALHLSVALLLWGVVGRTLRMTRVPPFLRESADGLALAAALLWVAHPICTQSVTYIYQRLEALASLACLAALYAFIRAVSSSPVDAHVSPGNPKSRSGKPVSDSGAVAGERSRRRWLTVSVAACVSALLTKESAAGLPLIILAYDALFVSDSWRQTARRGRYYLALVVCWGVLAALVLANTRQYEKAGLLVVKGVSSVDYALSQSGVILHYVRLVFWPTGQSIDYGWPVARQWYEFVPQTMVVGTAAAAAFVGLAKRRLWSFPLAAFFLLLAPTSSIVPIVDLCFEHRMYLPSACIVVLGVCGVRASAFACSERLASRFPAAARFALPAATALATLAMGLTTAARNEIYSNNARLWSDVVAKSPLHARGHCCLAVALFAEGHKAEARAGFERAVELDPDHTIALLNLASMVAEEGNFDGAEALLARAAVAQPEYTQTLYSYGMLRAAQGRTSEALQYLYAALDADPYNAAAMNQLGTVLLDAGRIDEAARWYELAIDTSPRDPGPRSNRAVVLYQQGRYDEAIAAFRETLQLDPRHVEAKANLGSALDHSGRSAEAVAELRAAVADHPDHVGCRVNLANILARQGEFAEAVAQYREALRMEPDNAQAAANLSQALAEQVLTDQAGAAPAPRL